MKNTIKILATVAIILFTSCSKDDGTETPTQEEIKLEKLVKEAEVALLFNGDAKDIKNKLRLGGANGGVNATLTTDRKGNSNKAYQFDGVDDYLQYSDIKPALNRKQFTISVWVKNDIFPVNGVYQSIFYRDKLMGSSLTLGINNGKNIQYLHSMFYRPNKSPEKRFFLANVNRTTFVNEWRHLAISYTKTTGNADFYIDGTFIFNGFVGGDIIGDGNRSFFIGGYEVSGSSFNGAIDDFYLFNKVLTDEEIKLLANDK